jgi:hypothetical protein
MDRLRIEGSYGVACIQQPDVDATPLVPAMPTLPQGAARPEVAANAELVENWVKGGLTAGAGTLSIGLDPESPSSVEPSGIPTLMDDGPASTDGVVGVADTALEVAEPQMPDIEGVEVIDDPVVVALTPPPSKVDIDPALPELDTPPSNVAIDAPLPAIFVPVLEQAELPPETDIGELKPPGLSSTAPNGTPAGPAGARGEVAMGGEAVLTCAELGSAGRSVAVVMAMTKRAIVDLLWLRIGFTVASRARTVAGACFGQRFRDRGTLRANAANRGL